MKRTSLIANLAIAITLICLSVAVFSADFDRIYSTVSAPITIGNKNLKNVSFMICTESNSDGAVVDKIMNEFAMKDTSATLFITGSWAIKNTQRIKTAQTAGFEIANQGLSGKSFKTMNAATQKKEILDTHTLIKGLTGIDMKFFMPPGGEYSKDTLKIAAELGYTVVMPSQGVNANSTEITSEAVYGRVIEGAKNGDLILIYPNGQTLQALPGILDYFKSSDFGIIKVCENIVF